MNFKVLVVEDGKLEQAILKKILEELKTECQGLEFIMVEDPAEAIKIVEEAAINLVILDNLLGEGKQTGVEIAPILKGKRPKIVIVGNSSTPIAFEDLSGEIINHNMQKKNDKTELQKTLKFYINSSEELHKHSPRLKIG